MSKYARNLFHVSQGKNMTRQAEECAMERLKNMSPVTSLWEMAEDFGGGKDFVIERNRAVEGKCSKLAGPELEVDLESSVATEDASSNKSTAVRKEVTTEPLWSGNYTLKYRGTLYSNAPRNDISVSSVPHI
jgi:hypothetical protein